MKWSGLVQYPKEMDNKGTVQASELGQSARESTCISIALKLGSSALQNVMKT